MTVSRKGFTLVEIIACTIIMSIVVLGTVTISNHITTLRTESRNLVQMNLHNLNVMERLRQMSYNLEDGEELLGYYSKDVFGSSDIDTEVYVDTAIWDDYRIYNVRIESRMRGYYQRLTSTYSMTNIGKYRRPSSLDDVYIPSL